MRSAKIDQPDLAFIRDEDIVRRYVPVNNVVRMYYIQSIQHRNKDESSICKSKYLTIFDHILDGTAAEVFHDDIACIIGTDTVMDLHNSLAGSKLRQFFCFGHESIQSRMELYAKFAPIRLNSRAVHAAGSEPRRIIFFYGYGTVQDRIFSDICNSKSSVAERFSDIISVVQDGSGMTAREAADQLAQQLGADVVQVIGNRFVLYRESRRDDVKKIMLVRE